MDRVDITFNLPQEKVDKAKARNLLTDEQLEHWIDQELVRQQRLDEFSDTVEKLRALEPPLTQEEIDAEIEDYRREKRQRKSADGT